MDVGQLLVSEVMHNLGIGKWFPLRPREKYGGKPGDRRYCCAARWTTLGLLCVVVEAKDALSQCDRDTCPAAHIQPVNLFHRLEKSVRPAKARACRAAEAHGFAGVASG